VVLADAGLNPRPGEAGGAQQDAAAASEAKGAGSNDRIGGWAEVALKAAAGKLPLDRGKRAAPLSPADAASRDAIRRQAELALLAAPYNPRALRILGQLAEAGGDSEAAAKFMRAAAERSSGESLAVLWMLQRSAQQKNYAQTMHYADVFLRKRPQFMEHVVPALAQMAESPDPRASAELKKVLLQNPRWRASFFEHLPARVSDARTPLNLLLGIKPTAAPPTDADVGAYLRVLIGHKLYELAYYTWLQFLSAEQLSTIGFLANDSFESAPSGLPFDWVISPGSGVTVDIAARPDEPDKHALLLELGPGRVEFQGVTQLVLLTPGSYRFKGMLKGELRGARGLQWRISCAGSGQPPLAEGPMFVGVVAKWSEFDIAFTVPDTDCRAQEVRLDLAARSASEQLVSGSDWYDDLQLARVPVGDKSQ
jgi:hypothetical protein